MCVESWLGKQLAKLLVFMSASMLGDATNLRRSAALRVDDGFGGRRRWFCAVQPSWWPIVVDRPDTTELDFRSRTIATASARDREIRLRRNEHLRWH